MAQDQAPGRRHRTARRLLIAVVVIAALVVLGAAAAIVVPILAHHSAGGSGQNIPEEIVSEASAEGADGRTRTLAVETESGEPADLSALRPGDLLIVRGNGYDADIGIYVSICAIPADPGEKPSPCLGGIPEGAMEGEGGASAADAEPETSVWITDDWAWRAFATQGYDDAEGGSFTARLLVPEPTQQGLDCTSAGVRCAVTTRADHTAATDRIQDVQLPVDFAVD